MTTFKFTLLTATALALSTMAAPSFAEEKPAAPAAVTSDYVILKAGDIEMKRSDVEAVWNSLFPPGQAPSFDTFDDKMKQNALRGMITEKLVLKEALKAGVADREDVKRQIENAKSKTILQAFMIDKTKDATSEEKLKAAFEKKNKETKPEEEIRARHILVKTEEEANKIAEELKKGGDFEKLAKEKSEDKGSGAQGGDLGYFNRGRMVKEFEESAFKLKKGEVSKPVKSDFGYHIIRLEDRRPMPKASFEQSREQLANEISGKIVQDYLNGLLKNTDVKYFGADGKELPFTKEFTPLDGAAKP